MAHSYADFPSISKSGLEEVNPEVKEEPVAEGGKQPKTGRKSEPSPAFLINELVSAAGRRRGAGGASWQHRSSLLECTNPDSGHSQKHWRSEITR